MRYAGIYEWQQLPSTSPPLCQSHFLFHSRPQLFVVLLSEPDLFTGSHKVLRQQQAVLRQVTQIPENGLFSPWQC